MVLIRVTHGSAAGWAVAGVLIAALVIYDVAGRRRMARNQRERFALIQRTSDPLRVVGSGAVTDASEAIIGSLAAEGFTLWGATIADRSAAVGVVERAPRRFLTVSFSVFVFVVGVSRADDALLDRLLASAREYAIANGGHTWGAHGAAGILVLVADELEPSVASRATRTPTSWPWIFVAAVDATTRRVESARPGKFPVPGRSYFRRLIRRHVADPLRAGG